MNLKELFTEDRGVSPVIGVILMVAITVILAAVIGAFVLGLGDQASSSAPQASFNYDFQNESNATVTHAGGDNIDSDTIEVNIGDTTAFPDNAEENANSSGWDNGDITTGDELELYDDDNGNFAGETVRIIWSNPSGGSSNTLSERTWPN